MIRFACSSCGASLKSLPRLAGALLNCPRCGQTVAVLTADCPVPLDAVCEYQEAGGQIVRKQESKTVQVLAQVPQ